MVDLSIDELDTAKNSIIPSRFIDSTTLVEKKKVYYETLNPKRLFAVPELGVGQQLRPKEINLPKNKEELKNNIWQRGYSLLAANSSVAGTLQVESYASNRRLPYQLSEASYVRVYATPKLTLVGLPFDAEVYYTTEGNSYYNSNTLGLHFNPSEYKDKVEKRLVSQQDELKENIKNNKLMQERIELYLEDVKHLLEAEKAALAKQQHKYGGQMDSLESLGHSKLNEAKDLPNQQLANMESKKDSLIQASIQRGKDSLTGFQDSSKMEAYQKQMQRRDSIQQVLLEKKAQIDELQGYYNQAARLYQLANKRDSLTESALGKLQQRRDSLQNSHSYKLRQKLKENPLMQYLDEFHVGTSNLYLSDNSFNGIPVRGLNTRLLRNNTYLQVAGGKTLSSFSGTPDENRANLFNRNLVGVKLGKASGLNSAGMLIGKVWDPMDSETTAFPEENLVVGVDVSAKPIPQLEVKAEVLTSSYVSNRAAQGTPELGYFDLRGQMGFGSLLLARSSMFASVIGSLDEFTEIQADYDQKNLGFNSLGNPFHRRDYRSMDVQLKRKFLKNKIHTSIQYKNFTNNLSNTSPSTNTLKGFGYSAYSSFRKAPNFQITHLPFEQGNNHGDTLFRTNNRLSTTIAGVTYRKTYRTKRFNWMATYTRSAVEYFQLGNQLTETRIIAANQTMETPMFVLTTGVTTSRVLPGVDTLNFNGVNALLTYKYRKHRFSASTRIKRSLANGSMVQGSLGYSTSLLSALDFRFTMGLQHIDGFWGMRDFTMYNGQMTLTYALNKAPVVVKPD